MKAAKSLWMLAAILICSTMNMLIACTEQSDNPVSPDAGETFSIVTLNVDGLPAYIDATPLGMDVMPLNVEGPGEKYTSVISQYLVEKDFDFIAVQEDFDLTPNLTQN